MERVIELTKKNIFLILFIFVSIAYFLNIAILGAVCIWSVLILLIFKFTKKVFKICGVDIRRTICTKDVIYMFFFSLISLLFVISFISRDRFLYFWDYSAYWGYCIHISNGMFIEPIKTLIVAIKSINTEEYNYFFPLILSIPFKILGHSFFSYVIAIFIVFFLPSIFLISVFINYICEKYFKISIKFYIIYTLSIFFPMTYIPILMGYVDVGELYFMTLFMLLIISYDFKKVEIDRIICVSISILLILFSRRYLGFFVFGTSISSLLYTIVYISKQKIKNSQYRNYLITSILTVLIVFVILYFIFNGYLERALFNNYSEVYKAYDIGDIRYKVISLFQWFGLGFLVLNLICFVFLSYFKSKESGIFLFSSVIITTFSFYTIQTMGMHQFYSIQIPIMVMVILNILFFSYKRMRIISSALLIMMLMNILSTFSFLNSYGIFSTIQYKPKIRNDIEQIYNIVNFVNEEAENKKKVFIISSSNILNDDIIRRCKFPYDLNAVPTLVPTCNVDLRDGFPVEFLDSNIIIVADPIQYHLNEEYQKITTFLGQEVLNQNSLIGRNFELEKTYTIDQGVRVNIYIKNKEFNMEQIDYLINVLDAFYPEYKEKFSERVKEHENSIP